MRRPAFPRARGGTGAFTLVELLVAVAVLALLVGMIAALMKGVTLSTNLSHAKMNADGQARLALDRFGFDFRRMLLRSDIDYRFVSQGGNDELSFYAAAAGYTGSRTLSVISYRVLNGALQRGANGLDVSQMVFAATAVSSLSGSTSLFPLLPQDGQFESLAPSIFRLEIAFLLKDGTRDASGAAVAAASVAAPPATVGIRNIASIVVAVAAIDSRAAKLVKDIATVAAVLPDARDGQDTAALWAAAMSQAGFAAQAKIPVEAVAGIHVYERSYDLLQSPSFP